MARSTDPKRTAAKSKMPAKRSPTRKGIAVGARRPQRPEEQAAAAGRPDSAAPESAGAPVPAAVGEPAPVPIPEVEASAAPPALTGEGAEPAASPEERPAVQPEPAAPARTEEVPSPPAEAAGAPRGDAAPALEPARAAMAEIGAETGAAAAAVAPRRSLVEGTIGMQGQMVAFACRQTEVGLAAGRAMLASRSLPEIVSVQSAFVGRSVENALAHTLELTRLSAEILRQGLPSGSAR